INRRVDHRHLARQPRVLHRSRTTQDRRTHHRHPRTGRRSHLHPLRRPQNPPLTPHNRHANSTPTHHSRHQLLSVKVGNSMLTRIGACAHTGGSAPSASHNNCCFGAFGRCSSARITCVIPISMSSTTLASRNTGEPSPRAITKSSISAFSNVGL